MQPGDLVALFRTSSGLGVLQQFTTDKRQLIAQIEATKFRSINSVDSLAPVVNNPGEDSGDATLAALAMEQRLRDEINDRARQDMVTAGMMQLPGAMGATRERSLDAIRRLIDAANRSAVVLYTIDPRGLVYTGITAADAPSGNPRRAQAQIEQRQMDFNNSQDGMQMMAEETGGVFYRNTNDSGAALLEAMNDQEGYYLLSIAPDDVAFDKVKASPRSHSVSVKVKGSGLKARYRHGYYGAQGEKQGKPVPAIVSAMISPFRATKLSVKMTPIFLSDATGKPLVRTRVHLDPSSFSFKDFPAEASDKNQQVWKQALVDQLVVLFDQNGQQVNQVAKTHSVNLRGEGYKQVLRSGLSQEIELPIPRPGAYQLRTAIQDQVSLKTGSATQFVLIPDLKNKKLAMSDLVVSSEGWMERNETEGGPAQRIMRQGEKLTYGAMVYNARLPKGGTSANLETQIVLYLDGKPVYTGKRTPFRPEGFKEGESLSVSGN